MRKLILLCFLGLSVSINAQTSAEIAERLKELQDKNKTDSIAKVFGYKGGEEVKVLSVFTLNSEGKAEVIKVSGPDPLFEKEAKKLIESLPQFEDDLFLKNEVGPNFSLPLIFKIETKRERRKRLKEEQKAKKV